MPLSDEEILKRFGKALKRERKRQGVSQEWLALEADIDRSYLGHVELGKENISLLKINKLCAVLRKKPSDLFSDVGL